MSSQRITDIAYVAIEDFNISISSYDPKTVMPVHCHEKPYLSLLLSGTYQEKNSNTIRIDSGTVIFRDACTEHSNVFSNSRSECLQIEVKRPEIFNLHNDINLPSETVARLGSIEIYKILHSIKTETSNDILNILCYEAFNAHFDFLQINGNIGWVSTVKEMINDAPFENLSMSRLSTNLNLHPNYIIRKFKEKTGYKLSEYLSKTRMEFAISNMLKEEDNLTNIALGAGFYDQSHFIKKFNTYFHTTPSKFRRQVQN